MDRTIPSTEPEQRAAATELAETETDDQLEQRLMTWLASE